MLSISDTTEMLSLTDFILFILTFGVIESSLTELAEA